LPGLIDAFAGDTQDRQEMPMAIRFSIKNLLIVTALAALLLAFYAPELRSLDKTAQVVFAASGIITAVSLVSFTPVWVALFWLRRRSRRGLGFRAIDYAIVFVAFLSGLGIIVGIIAAIVMIIGK
jgi:hypothetical protein